MSSLHELSVAYDRYILSENELVYPVLSRRAGGISLGINTFPDKQCNFSCIYCDVDRLGPKNNLSFDLETAISQLRPVLLGILLGHIFAGEGSIKAITLSGEGEPTLLPNFDQVISRIEEVKREFGLNKTKIVVISNATGLHRPEVMRGLAEMYSNDGELWAKLDAGTQEFFDKIAKTKIPLSLVLKNIVKTASLWPIKIQTCFMNISGIPPTVAQVEAYCDRVREICESGGKIKAIQLYNVLRPPAEPTVTPLTEEQLVYYGQLIQQNTGVAVEVYK